MTDALGKVKQNNHEDIRTSLFADICGVFDDAMNQIMNVTADKICGLVSNYSQAIGTKPSNSACCFGQFQAI